MYLALQLAKAENYSKICIEGDAKLGINALNGSMTDVWWKIDTFCKDSKTLSLDFDVCSFVGCIERQTRWLML
jgi:hypothetical protein